MDSKKDSTAKYKKEKNTIPVPLLYTSSYKKSKAPRRLKTEELSKDAIFANPNFAEVNFPKKNASTSLGKKSNSLVRTRNTSKTKNISLKFEIHEKDIRSKLVSKSLCDICSQKGLREPLIVIGAKKDIRINFLKNLILRMQKIKTANDTEKSFTVASIVDTDFNNLCRLRKKMDLVILELSNRSLWRRNRFSATRLKQELNRSPHSKNNLGNVVLSMDRDILIPMGNSQKKSTFMKIRIIPNSESRVMEKRSTKKGTIKIEKITRIVAKHFGVPEGDLFLPDSNRRTILATQCAMYLAIYWTNLKKSAVGLFFKRMNHTTVLYAEKKIQNLILKDPKFALLLNKIVRDL